MLKTPNLQLRHAMKAANYSDDEIADIAFRCFLQRALPGGSIKGLREHVAAGLPAPPDRADRQHVRANPTAITSIERTPSIQHPTALNVPREPVIGITPSPALPHVHLPSADDAVTPVAAGLSKRITASKRTLYNKTHHLKKEMRLLVNSTNAATPQLAITTMPISMAATSSALLPWEYGTNGTVRMPTASKMAKSHMVKPAVDKILNAVSIELQPVVLRTVTDHRSLTAARILAGIDTLKAIVATKYLCE